MDIEKPQIKKTWKPTVAGAIDIACCIMGAPGALFMWFFLLLGIGMGGLSPLLALIATAVPLTIFILAITGGINSIRRRRWRLALAGSISIFLGAVICSIFLLTFFLNVGDMSDITAFGFLDLSLSGILAVTLLLVLVGIAPMVLVVLSKSEFD